MTQTTEPPQEVIQKARDRLVALTKQHEADWGLGHESYCHIDSAAQELVWVFEIETETPEDPDVPQDKPDAPETENHAGEFPQPRGPSGKSARRYNLSAPGITKMKASFGVGKIPRSPRPCKTMRTRSKPLAQSMGSIA